MKTTENTRLSLSAFYDTVGGDIGDVEERLEDLELVESFVREFEDDNSCSELFKNIQSGYLQGAFRSAHTLKGICRTLGFTRLGECSADVCDALRKGIPPSEMELRKLASEYDCLIYAIHKLKKAN